eukprot:CAMPEP_0176410740 /NCGR_PEP_ID=MMETSP0127-20121128/3224_1 /TAXON_ID=938130 /ORGANISM="Platyophrya macrostoma, Strain WH" /LENGTH=54 /DNA_ID=CAMNT_0017790269 /DNA_START=512 /DNA_END=676 /DNA_ORIENTATION=+
MSYPRTAQLVLRQIEVVNVSFSQSIEPPMVTGDYGTLHEDANVLDGTPQEITQV